MSPRKMLTAYYTLVRKDVIRLFRIWSQTLLPSVINITLYYIIFGAFIGSQIRGVGGFTYMQFIVPGLIMMAVITNAFSNVASSFFAAKWQRNIEEFIVSPTPSWVIIAGFITGGVLRGLLVGALVLAISLFFTHLTVFSVGIILLFIILTSILFSFAGLLNALFAKSFDGISIIPTFVLVPLTYLGGVFYSINLLPPIWQVVSKFNPILYMVNGFRYGFLGISDMNVYASFWVLAGFIILAVGTTLYLFKNGYGLKN